MTVGFTVRTERINTGRHEGYTEKIPVISPRSKRALFPETEIQIENPEKRSLLEKLQTGEILELDKVHKFREDPLIKKYTQYQLAKTGTLVFNMSEDEKTELTELHRDISSNEAYRQESENTDISKRYIRACTLSETENESRLPIQQCGAFNKVREIIIGAFSSNPDTSIEVDPDVNVAFSKLIDTEGSKEHATYKACFIAADAYNMTDNELSQNPLSGNHVDGAVFSVYAVLKGAGTHAYPKNRQLYVSAPGQISVILGNTVGLYECGRGQKQAQGVIHSAPKWMDRGRKFIGFFANTPN